MKKLFLSMAIFAVGINFISCADDLDAQEIFVPEKAETRQTESTKITKIQQKALDEIYKFCVESYGKELEKKSYNLENPTNEEKIAVIKYCDYELDQGDYICEMPEYDEIREILWPYGYGIFREE